jgi:hypothetical protein
MRLSGISLLIFPVVLGGLGGFAGFHVLFKVIQTVSAKWGRKVATATGAILVGLVLFVWGGYTVGFGDFRGLVITGSIPGVAGVFIGGVFSYGVAGEKKILVRLCAFMIGLFLGALVTISALFSFFIISGSQGLLVFGLNYLLGILGGISGAATATGVSFFKSYSKPGFVSG